MEEQQIVYLRCRLPSCSNIPSNNPINPAPPSPPAVLLLVFAVDDDDDDDAAGAAPTPTPAPVSDVDGADAISFANCVFNKVASTYDMT
jgi:hypothetical protein